MNRIAIINRRVIGFVRNVIIITTPLEKVVIDVMRQSIELINLCFN